MPINRKYPIAALLDACVRYLERAPRDFVTFEYVMLDGVNDSAEHARALAARVRDVPCKFNLIPWNPFPGAEFRTSPRARILAFQKALIDAGYVATIRKTRGDNIDAACGQLAGRVRDRTKRTRPHPTGARRAGYALRLALRSVPTMTPLASNLRAFAARRRARARRVRVRAAGEHPRRRASPTVAAAGQAAGSHAEGAREAARGSRGRLLRARPHGHRARGAQRSRRSSIPTNARIYNLFGLVYAMLGENAKAEQNFQRALAMAPQDSDIHHNWGWYLCSNGRPRESIPEFEKALAQSAVQDARDRADQRGPLQHRDRRSRTAPTTSSAARKPPHRTTRRRSTASR